MTERGSREHFISPPESGPAASIRLENLTCDFPGVRALDNINLEFYPGKIHAITGENGAGKSTVLKILSGWVKPTGGSIQVGSSRFESLPHPTALGIRTIPQEPALATHLTVAENIFLGRLPQTDWRTVDWLTTFNVARGFLSRVGLDRLPPREIVSNLSLAQTQLVEIARAISNGGEIFLFDEPTSSLSSPEANQVAQLIRELRASQKTILYVSHRMHEIFAFCDYVTILRDGKVVATLPVNATQADDVIRLMIGREVRLKARVAGQFASNDIRLHVKGLQSKRLKSIDFAACRGEIVGLAGLMGAGRTTLLQTLFGYHRATQGWIEVDGQRFVPQKVRQSMNAGLAYVPEDRKTEGLAMQLTLAENFGLPSLDRLQRCGWLRRQERTRTAEIFAKKLGIRCRRVSEPVERLSGGNQQKIVLGKWLAREPKVLLLDEPTRGIDMGAKADIHHIIQALAQKGHSVIFASSDMPELLSVCDRILVMRNGAIAGELKGEERTEEAILRMAGPAAQAPL